MEPPSYEQVIANDVETLQNCIHDLQYQLDYAQSKLNTAYTQIDDLELKNEQLSRQLNNSYTINDNNMSTVWKISIKNNQVTAMTFDKHGKPLQNEKQYSFMEICETGDFSTYHEDFDKKLKPVIEGLVRFFGNIRLINGSICYGTYPAAFNTSWSSTLYFIQDVPLKLTDFVSPYKYINITKKTISRDIRIIIDTIHIYYE